MTLAGLVALRKESVDRNLCFAALKGREKLSLSARRAWIEILFGRCYTWIDGLSLSARRAWIEMALLELIPLSDPRRSPQGERG